MPGAVGSSLGAGLLCVPVGGGSSLVVGLLCVPVGGGPSLVVGLLCVPVGGAFLRFVAYGPVVAVNQQFRT